MYAALLPSDEGTHVAAVVSSPESVQIGVVEPLVTLFMISSCDHGVPAVVHFTYAVVELPSPVSSVSASAPAIVVVGAVFPVGSTIEMLPSVVGIVPGP
jgi:hypothetical protein